MYVDRVIWLVGRWYGATTNPRRILQRLLNPRHQPVQPLHIRMVSRVALLGRGQLGLGIFQLTKQVVAFAIGRDLLLQALDLTAGSEYVRVVRPVARSERRQRAAQGAQTVLGIQHARTGFRKHWRHRADLRQLRFKQCFLLLQRGEPVHGVALVHASAFGARDVELL